MLAWPGAGAWGTEDQQRTGGSWHSYSWPRVLPALELPQLLPCPPGQGRGQCPGPGLSPEAHDPGAAPGQTPIDSQSKGDCVALSRVTAQLITLHECHISSPWPGRVATVTPHFPLDCRGRSRGPALGVTPDLLAHLSLSRHNVSSDGLSTMSAGWPWGWRAWGRSQGLGSTLPGTEGEREFLLGRPLG